MLASLRKLSIHPGKSSFYDVIKPNTIVAKLLRSSWNLILSVIEETKWRCYDDTRKHSSRAKVISRDCVPDEIAQILQNAPTTRKAKAQSISLYNCAFGLSCLAWLTSMELYKKQEAQHHVYPLANR